MVGWRLKVVWLRFDDNSFGRPFVLGVDDGIVPLRATSSMGATRRIKVSAKLLVVEFLT